MRRPISPARWVAERVHASICVATVVLCALHALHSTFPIIPTVLP